MSIKIKTTEAAILIEQRQPLAVDEVYLPATLEVGQVLVEVLFSGICGSQLGEIAGAKGPDLYLPHLLGHEGSGKVLATGPGVSSVKKSDHVVLHWRPGSGIQSVPPTYQWRKRSLNAGFVTTFNRHAIVSENRVTAIPKDYPLELAALFGCAVTTGIGVVENKASLKMGESVVVVGSGGVGLNVIQGAKLLSASPIIAVDLFENRVQLARTIGASHGLINVGPSWLSQVRDIVGVGGADLVVDNTGDPDVISQCIELTKPAGKTILIGVPPRGTKTAVNTLPLHFGKVLTGTHGGDGAPDRDIPRLLRLSQAEILDLSRLITATYSLPEINNAIDDMRSGKVSGRCVISM
jgi:S-(hydroxymethyl)glutathione dehydrogenase / alcohol dehydrogenase